MERTYVMLKPDAYERGLMGEVIKRIEAKGYKIMRMELGMVSDEQVTEHYGHLKNDSYPKEAFEEVRSYIKRGPVVKMIIEGPNVITGIRRMIGPTKEEKQVAGELRFELCCSTQENLIHASDSIETAEIEIQRFFG